MFQKITSYFSAIVLALTLTACANTGGPQEVEIRTGVIEDKKLHVQAGAGIVADSNPESEWQETQNKARAVLRAAELAEQGLDTRFN